MKVRIATAILALEPTASFSVIDEDLEQIEWYSEGVEQPSNEDIQSKLDELQAIEDAKEYQRDRETQYPEIKEQLDLLYHDMTAGKGDKTGEWYKALKTVKDNNPKP